MKWQVTTPPAAYTFPSGSTDVLRMHLRSEPCEEYQLLQFYAAAAVDYAQDAMACSLLSQGITATFYDEDARNRYPQYMNPYNVGGADAGMFLNRLPPTLALPRGPVTAVNSVVDGKGNPITAYTLEKQGTTDAIRINVAYGFPLTVVYTAGYANSAAVPPAITAALLAHIGTLYARRESVSDKSLMAVPHSLEAFYNLKARRTIGG